MLENLGFLVLMTRSGDYDLATNEQNRKKADIEKRCSMIEGSLLYVSVHINEYHDSSVRGAQVFYSNQNINNKYNNQNNNKFNGKNNFQKNGAAPAPQQNNPYSGKDH